MNIHTPDDILIDELKKCNHEALIWIEKKYKKSVIAWARKKFGISLELANELWIEVLIALSDMFCVRQRDLLVQLFTLLCAIMENRYLTYYRQQQQLQKDIPPLEGADPQEELLKKEAIEQWVRKKMAQLDPNCFSLFYLTYYEKMRYAQIAKILNYANEGVVRNLMNRCRNYFRKHFPYDPDHLPDYDPSDDL